MHQATVATVQAAGGVRMQEVSNEKQKQKQKQRVDNEHCTPIQMPQQDPQGACG